jgi:putative ABC transport system permease protein
VLLALTGGVVGVALAYWGIELLAAFTPPALTFLNVNEIALERRVLGFAVILTALTAAGVGLVPALRGSRTVLHESLKAGTRAATAGPRQERVRRAFVVVQLAVSLVLLVGAGLLTRSFAHMTRIDPGFDARQLVTASLSLPRWKYPTAAAQQQFYADAVQRLRALAGVRSATLAGGAPPQGGGFSFGLQFDVEGRGIVLNDPDLILPFVEVQPEYFSVMGIPLRAGRTFSGEDTPTSPPSIVISEEMARQLWKGEPPVGRRIRMGPERPWYTVVGVVGDVYQLEHARPRGMFAVYYAMSQSRGIAVQQTLIVRTAGEPEGMIGAIKRQIWSVDPDQAILEIATLESQYAEFFATPRFYAFLMTAFAAFGLIVSAVGLYGVLAYAMAQRTREFGIRMALGARSRDVLGMVLRSGGVLTAAGMALGAAGSVAITRALESLLVDVPRTDPVTYAAVIAVLSAAAMAATWFPARRATRVDPIVALRQE